MRDTWHALIALLRVLLADQTPSLAWGLLEIESQALAQAA